MNKNTVVTVLVVISLLFSGCSEQSSQPQSASSTQTADLPTVGIGFSFGDLDDNYLSVVKQGLEEQDEADDSIGFVFTDAAGDDALQIQEIQNLLEMGLDVIAVSLEDVDDAATICNLAKATEVEVVFFGNQPSAELLSEYDNYRYVGIDYEMEGQLQADMAITAFNNADINDNNGDGVMQYLLLKGEEQNPLATKRSDSLNAAATAATAQLVAEADTDWSISMATQQTESWINDGTMAGVDVIFCNSDSIALGVIEAITASQMDVAIYGIDAIPQAIDAIDNGELDGTVYNNPYIMAEAISTVAANLARDFAPTENSDLTENDRVILVAPQSIYLTE